MAEVLDQANQTQQSAFSETAPAPKKKKKRNKKLIIRRIITLLIVAAVGVGGYYAWKQVGKKEEAPSEILRETVQRGSITSMVNGSGAAVAKNSASITLLTGGTVREVFVSEGDYVTEGTPLFEIDSKEAEDNITKARERVRDAERALSERQTDLSRLLAKPTQGDAKAEYAGILTDVKRKELDDTIAEGEVLATLVDNTRMLLTLYVSYAYENDVRVGQSAAVSIPVTMTQLSGEVYEIHKVERINAEGGRMFEVVVAIDNPGSLTADMEATATISAGGDTIYPYAPGKFAYFRSTSIKSPLAGKVTSFDARDYQKVYAGQSIAHVKVDDTNREDEIRSHNERIEDAKKALEEAQATLDKELKNLENLSAVSPIDGTVLSLGIQMGEEVKAGTVAVNIADTSTMIVNAMLDEMYVSYAQVGMPVTITLWEQELYGTIESVSLTAQGENGIARFPMVIAVDNSEGLLMTGAYVDYSFTASQSDDCLIVPIQCVKSAQTTEGDTCKVLFVESDTPFDNDVELTMDKSQIPEGFQVLVVETGISDNNNIEILSGAEEGMTVYAGVVQTMDEGGMGGFYF